MKHRASSTNPCMAVNKHRFCLRLHLLNEAHDFIDLSKAWRLLIDHWNMQTFHIELVQSFRSDFSLSSQRMLSKRHNGSDTLLPQRFKVAKPNWDTAGS